MFKGEKMTTYIKIPIDFKDVAEKTGLKSGKLCKSIIFGWGVQNTNSVEGVNFAEYLPPADIGDIYEEKEVIFVEIIDGRFWRLSFAEYGDSIFRLPEPK